MSDGVRDKVLAILEKMPLARNSDNVLLLEYWKEYDDSIFQKIIDILGYHNIAYNLTPFDSVRRWRQKIQNEEGLFKPDEDVARGRLERQAEMQKEFKHE